MLLSVIIRLCAGGYPPRTAIDSFAIKRTRFRLVIYIQKLSRAAYLPNRYATNNRILYLVLFSECLFKYPASSSFFTFPLAKSIIIANRLFLSALI